jgi:long-chain fatty acid transport protein
MMKKMVIALAVIGLLCATASPLLAGGILNKSNLSADYFRSLTRHASTDAADIVAFNPAGVMKMDNGIYLKADALYITKDYSNTVPSAVPIPNISGKFESDEPSIVPGLFSVYKRDKWAGFFAVTVPGGGGEVKFKDGNARTGVLGFSFVAGSPAYTAVEAMQIEANSVDLAFTLGGAYEINEMFSVAGGLRYINAHQEFKGSVTLTSLSPLAPPVQEVDLERTATGIGYFLGLNVAATDKVNLGFLYQSNTELDFESDVKKDTSGGAIPGGVGWADGTKEREDLPGILGFGLSYQFSPKVLGQVNYTQYLESAAKWEGERFKGAGDSSEIGISFTYTFNPQWRGSIGYLRTDIAGMKKENLLPEAPELDASTIGIGAVYSPTDRWDISFGYTDVTYDSVVTAVSSSRAFAGTKLEKRSTALSLGAQYRF